MTAVAALPTCRKCGRELKRNGEDWFCASCWVTVELPSLTPEEAERELGPKEGNHKRSDAVTPPSPKWTEEERLAWATWKEGDPVPNEPQRMEPDVDSLKTLDTRQLGARCVEQLRYLQEQNALLEAKRDRIAEEAKKLLDIAKLCGASVPESLASLARGSKAKPGPKPKQNAGPARGEFKCELCDNVSPTAQGASAHRRFNHADAAA